MITKRGSRRANVSDETSNRDRRRRQGVGCLLAVALALAATGVAAQSPSGSGSGDDGTGSSGGSRRRGVAFGDPQKKPPIPEVKIAPDPWPRLDPGAVFCRTEEDLRQHLAAVAARLDGSTARYAEAPGCRVIRARTAVSVVSRQGPGRTQVKLSEAAADTGWTDAFLPEKRTGH